MDGVAQRLKVRLKNALLCYQRRKNHKIEQIQKLVLTLDGSDSVVRTIYRKLEGLKGF